MVTTTTSSSSSTGTNYCNDHPSSDMCQKPTSTNAALPIALGVAIPIAVAVVLSFLMYQRFKRRLLKEDENLAHIDISDMPINDSDEKGPSSQHHTRNVFEDGDDTESNGGGYNSPYLFTGPASNDFATSKASIDSLHSFGGPPYDGPYRFVNASAISRPTSSNSSARSTNHHPYQYRPYPLPNHTDNNNNNTAANSALKHSHNADQLQPENNTASGLSRDLTPKPYQDEDSVEPPLNRMNTIQESETSRPGTAASINQRHSATPSVLTNAENRHSRDYTGFTQQQQQQQQEYPSSCPSQVDRSSDSSPDTSSNKYYISPFQSYGVGDNVDTRESEHDDIVSRTSSVSPANESIKHVKAAELSEVLPASLPIQRELDSDDANVYGQQHEENDSAAAERASRVRSVYRMYFDEQTQTHPRGTAAAAATPVPASRRRVTPYIPQQQQQQRPSYGRSVKNSNNNGYRSPAAGGGGGGGGISRMTSNSSSSSSNYFQQARQASVSPVMAQAASGLPAACKMGDDPFASPLIYSPPDKGYNNSMSNNVGAKGSMSPSSWGGSPLADNDDMMTIKQQPLPSASQLEESQLTGLGFMSPKQHGGAAAATSPRQEQIVRGSVLMEQVMQPVRPSWNMNR